MSGLDLTGDPIITLSTHVSALVPEVQTITTSAGLRFAEQSIHIRAMGSGLPRAYVPEVQVVHLYNASGGSFSLHLASNSTAAIPYSATAAIARQALLDGFKLLSDVAVTRTDVGARHRQFSVTFSSYSGSLPRMTVNTTQLVSASGYHASAGVSEAVKGSVQEVQRVKFSAKPLGGHFALVYRNTHTAETLAYNASAKAVKQALEDLQVLGRVGVSKANTTGAIPAWTITFLDLAGDVPLLTAVSNLWAGNTVSGIVPHGLRIL